MKVKVIPVRPIPGILPKNKWIDMEMDLDLNKNEIVHCMQFGNVYDEDGKIIDAISVHKSDFMKPKMKAVETIEAALAKPAIIEVNPINPLPESIRTEEVVEEQVLEEIEEVIETATEVPVFKLEEVSCVKEENYIILETQLKTNSKLEGNLYGLFSITSGPKPVVEVKVNDGWSKFGNKFADFNSMEDGTKLVFRFLPKNENEFSYRLSIKEANEILVKLEGKVNPAKL